MPSELTVHPTSAVSPAETQPEPKPATAPHVPPPSAGGSSGQPYVNPTLRLDPALGLVVIEFRDDAGKVTSIPSQRQIEAYRAHQQAPPGAHAPAAKGTGQPASTHTATDTHPHDAHKPVTKV